VDANNTNQQCNLSVNPSCVLAATQLDYIEIYGAGFSPTGGNTAYLGQQPLIVTWDAGRSQVNVQIPCSVPAGTWTLTVSSPNSGSIPSNGASVTVSAGAGCQ